MTVLTLQAKRHAHALGHHPQEPLTSLSKARMGGRLFGQTRDFGVGFWRRGIYTSYRAASASCCCLKASYSGVPGRGGRSFGRPPAQRGMYSPIVPPPVHDARTVPAITSAIRRAMAGRIAWQAG